MKRILLTLLLALLPWSAIPFPGQQLLFFQQEPFAWTKTGGQFSTAGSTNCLTTATITTLSASSNRIDILGDGGGSLCTNLAYARTGQLLSGKVYAEFKYVNTSANDSNVTAICFGVADSGAVPTAGCNAGSGDHSSIRKSGGCGLSAGYANAGSFTVNSSYNYVSGDIIMIAFDTSTRNIWYGKNGSWISGNPGTLTSPTTTLTGSNSNFYFYTVPYCLNGLGTGVTWTSNIYAGTGSQTYAVPSGFSAYAPYP